MASDEDIAREVAELHEALQARDLWKDKWRTATAHVQELHDEIERLRNERDELRGERNEARRMVPIRAKAKPRPFAVQIRAKNQDWMTVRLTDQSNRAQALINVPRRDVKIPRGAVLEDDDGEL